MAIINGKRVEIPNSGVYGSELIKAAGQTNGRRTVLKRPGSFSTEVEQIHPQKHYPKDYLIDNKGREVKVSTIPDRTKGITYHAPRTALSKQIITEQVFDVAENLYKKGIDFDEQNADWMVVPNYPLPEIWSSVGKFSPLLIVFPTEYPEIPPVGFYMRATLNLPHFFEQAYHEADKTPLTEGWKWYCVYVPQGAWKPVRVRGPGDWKHGDNLWTYLTLIREVLSSPEN